MLPEINKGPSSHTWDRQWCMGWMLEVQVHQKVGLYIINMPFFTETG
jgi:hypothetical protein